MPNWVLVDTCIWASFFAKPSSIEKREVDALIDTGRVALIGPILSEVLMGFRKPNQAKWVASRLRLTHWIGMDWNDWRQAADLGRDLSANGKKIPLTDLVLASIAIRRDLPLYSIDPHFDLIPGLKRYTPSA